ncbi:bifunctional demethylmenaquinone methyltransferase/2-methoxy-6-polyprenyl-1,4-benzoquinol methylase UbiE [Actinotignum schaalii]|uniref:bifunctional demethylmenaquinone methyltransferase/2-methoxy-6-polyprenyl-1,4-benzoquinol methylase UbiE n=1 Tax=Actinomycetaceae TaxID=2049 RepID=UPI00237E1348|nr:bifunctional demethylmenaquinone methyltransferase/2-methoxy-6-polyprenyl-1,4-benzoquinol methylase UbiE [Actinotignum schaalii]MDE1654204.1 bifunctional demethylmenaquinone methyltransferase/2-methoxy-6-polyprenyl-1,4-benzoquinol methylase UbiE [Actinotignum schaalii]
MSARAQLSKDPRAVAGMFDQVAPRYDLSNDLLSFGQVRLWRRYVTEALRIEEGMEILDLACGTGTSTEHFARVGARVVGADFSDGMLEVARLRHPDLRFVQADACDLPFANNTFDAVTISYGLRNIHDPQRALEEMARVTRPGGHVVIAEFSTPSCAPFRALYHGYLRHVLPRVAALASSDGPAYAYLMESIIDWPDQRTLAGWLHEAGWRDVEYRNMCNGIVALHRATLPAAH